MKIIFFILLLSSLTGCCCSLEKAGHTLDMVFVEQWNRGLEHTSENIHTIGSYLEYDVTTCADRLGTTVSTIVEPANISDTPKRLAYTKDFFIKQWGEGIKDTSYNIKSIAKYLCLCGDE